MSNTIDSSPRAAKRRRLLTHETSTSKLQATNTPPKPSSSRASRRHSQAKVASQEVANCDHDSAYGSKEDSLVEGEEGNVELTDTTGETLSGLEVGQGASDTQKQTKPAPKDVQTRKSARNESPLQKENRKTSRGSCQKQSQMRSQIESDRDATLEVCPDFPTEQAKSIEDLEAEVLASPQPRSSSRARRKPRKFSVAGPENRRDLSVDGKESQKRTPKGILTPKKHQRTGPRKSVAFNQNEAELGTQLGFRDISSSTKKKSLEANDEMRPEPAEGLVDVDEITHVLGITECAAVREFVTADDVDDDSDDLASQQLRSSLASTSITVESAPELLGIQDLILSRLVTFKEGPLDHLDTQYNTVSTLLSATIAEGESNSILLLGARGSGKSLMLETALRNMEAEHKDDFHTVRLNGFFQTDDRLALREIWRQLGREMHIAEEETGEVSSYADIMASLLTLLSHPEELDPSISGSNNAQQTAKSVIIVLDEFDLFTAHPRQTLLYNLFDIAQSRKAPIAVIGCSTRMDVIDCLEKRVKSRFSHRWLFVPSSISFSAFEDAIRNTLLLRPNDDKVDTLSKSHLDWQTRWNDYITTCFMQNAAIQALLKQAFYSSKSIANALSALYPVIAMLKLYPSGQTLATSSPSALEEIVNSSVNVSAEPSLLTLLTTMPPLHVGLLVASARLETIHHLSSVNLNLVYAHYKELIQRSRLQASAGGSVAVGPSLRLWNRITCRGVWEDLCQQGFLIPVTAKEEGELGGAGGTGGNGGDEGGSTRMYKVDVTLEEVDWAVRERNRKATAGGGMAGMAEIISKWCHEI